ncbi:MAG: porin family protein [Woeseiaceae bacterium]|nr:porin family protein [Woeseiaceae bacterium]
MKTIAWNAQRVLALAGLALMPITATADSGPYIGASAGGASFEADLNDPTIPGLPSSLDEDDTAVKIFVGYKVDLPVIDFAIEGGYVNFGEPDIDVLGSQLTFETTGFNAWGIAAIDAGLLDIYGKLGLIAWDVEAAFQGSSISDDGSDLGYGLGLRFDLGALEIRGEYEIYDLDDTDVAMLSVGLAWHFD